MSKAIIENLLMKPGDAPEAPRRRLADAVWNVMVLPAGARSAHRDWSVVAFATEHMLQPSFRGRCVRDMMLRQSTSSCGSLLPVFPRPLHLGLYGPWEGMSAEEPSQVKVIATGILDYCRDNEKNGKCHKTPQQLDESDADSLADLLYSLLKESTATSCYRHDIPRRLHEECSRKRPRSGRGGGVAEMRAELGKQQAIFLQLTTGVKECDGPLWRDECTAASSELRPFTPLWPRLREAGGCGADLLGNSLPHALMCLEGVPELLLVTEKDVAEAWQGESCADRLTRLKERSKLAYGENTREETSRK